jgi:uncharacterized protein YbjQ (UPF0145 family)
MILSTTDNIPGKKVANVLGMVRGNTVRARWFGRDIAAGLKSIVGGEIASYTKLMTDAREQSIKRMVAEAKKLGADAVLEIRFTTSMVMQNASEILVYGTAVKLG